MYLKKPSKAEEDEILQIIKEVNNLDGNFEGARSIKDIDDYDEWLEKLKLYENPNTVPSHLVPGSTYLAMEDDRVIGIINVRWYLNEALKKHGGHIGYFIRPSERGKGKGTKMLALCLNEIRNKDKNIDKVMITCRKENIASARVMEKNGGVYEDNYIEESSGKTFKRYWINLK